MKISRYLTPATLFISFLFLYSCKKFDELDKIAKTAWNPNLAIPIGYSEFDVYDILAAQDSTDLIIIDQNTGEIALSYSDEIISVDASNLVNFGQIDQDFVLSLSDLNVPTSPSFNGNVNSFKTEILALPMQNGEEIKSVFFKSGTLNLHFETTLRHDFNVTVTFPDFTKNSVPLSDNFTMTYAGTVPQTHDLQVDLSEVMADFTNLGTSVNETRVQIQVNITGSGQPVFGNEDLNLNIFSSGIDFHNVTGYIGQQNIAQAVDSVLLKVFENASPGVFELVNPTIDFIADNSFGFPIQVNLNELKTINETNGQVTQLLNFPTSFNITAPAVIGNNSISQFQLNNSNTSNLSSVISPTPKYFYYDIDGLSNPNGQSGPDNFIDENSRCIIRTEVNLPLEGYAYGFTYHDTLDFQNFENQDVSLIESVMIRLIVNNGFPVKLGTQIKALDENYNELFTLFDQVENVVEAASVDSNGKVISAKKKITDISLTQNEISQLNKVKKLIVYGTVSTTNSSSAEIVKLYDFYTFGIKLAMQTQINSSF